MSNDNIPEGYRRVTEIISPFTPFHKMDVDSVFAMNTKVASDRGTRVHSYCENYALGLFVADVDSDCLSYFNAFKAWFDEMVVEVVCTEQRINSARYKLSGCIDLLCVLKGDKGVSLVDIKTPVSCSNTWRLQTAAYKILIEDELVIPVDRRVVVKLPKPQRDIQIIEHPQHDEDEKLFKYALELYNFVNN